MAHLYDQLASAIAKSAQDPAYRTKLLSDANGTLKADGVDIGGAKITMEWTEITNVLSILVENGGANWNGSIVLAIKK
ncbi:hypothetical protein [Undibacterium sp. TS12]|uniref:hypothetical protein n=1 Tax=Undibacterium sp. TS12 TaxID=2908202 RepID=UPI001F4C5FFF|nr:hypothetical protein [Undibacterium sp. TS12]MCH8621028.1 hypothetical protein [Undibacterium sp. TS12]